MLSQRFAYLPRAMFTILDVENIKTPSLPAVCARFALRPFHRLEQDVDDLLAFFPGLVYQTDIGGVTDICRSTGCINDQLSFVAA